MLRRVLKLIVGFVLVFGVLQGYAGSIEKLKKDRDMLLERMTEVLNLVRNENQKLKEVKTLDQYRAVMDGVLDLLAEKDFLTLAVERVDKIIFGLNVLAGVGVSEKDLIIRRYGPVTGFFVVAAEGALDVVKELDKEYYTVETRRLAREVTKDLEEFLDLYSLDRFLPKGKKK
jgi:hypothetical protein